MLNQLSEVLILKTKVVCVSFRPIDGISTYNVIPFEAGQYFNKEIIHYE